MYVLTENLLKSKRLQCVVHGKHKTAGLIFIFMGLKFIPTVFFTPHCTCHESRAYDPLLYVSMYVLSAIILGAEGNASTLEWSVGALGNRAEKRLARYVNFDSSSRKYVAMGIIFIKSACDAHYSAQINSQ
jgi:hypothetical protein